MARGRHVEKARLRPWVKLLTAAVFLSLLPLGWAAVSQARRSDAGAEPECASTTISAVGPMIKPLTSAARALTREGCTPVTIKEQQPDAVIEQLRQGSCPGLWVPDSPLRALQASTGALESTPMAPSLAMTPVGLAGGPAGTSPESWTAALSSGNLALADPAEDLASAAALLGPVAEASVTGSDATAAQAAIVGVAQRVSAQTSSGTRALSVTDIAVATEALVPVTEQDFVEAAATNPALTWASPETGVLSLTFPLLVCHSADSATRTAGAALAAWLASPAGTAALEAAHLRQPSGEPLDEGVGMGEVSQLAEPAAQDAQQLLNAWRVLSVPSSMLVVYDVSGSMDYMAGDLSRIDLAAEAAHTALGAIPDSARIGMWAFSVNQGGEGQDWREMAPLRVLSDKVRGRTHEQVLRERIDRLAEITSGGTGLYDTTLAAYRHAVRRYDPRFFNAVVLLSDGANDDPGSIGLEELLTKIAALRDPARPVRIIAVGISDDADLDALNKITAATGGQAFVARDPRNILDVLSSGLMGRKAQP